ncbi:hypothetical protein [Paenibacillus flagellatus]|uniref:Uncharacterized protein n=1 Tax=Paenibacillus flagellatus TaxID=2211139 RepID=A0A2V5KLC6_9BACL|nr:hypothetical protein [Paenibacillus flagellatus]PYI55790.1 hypothetical protein DLM86_08725 [Paenibacillus flagellatus]
MGNVYHAFDHEYELYVEEHTGGRYHVVLNVYAEREPVVLHAYSAKEEAIAAAQTFPKLYRIAQQRGFRLDGQYFEHPDGRSVHVSFAMEPGTTTDRFMKVLV